MKEVVVKLTDADMEVLEEQAKRFGYGSAQEWAIALVEDGMEQY